MTERNGDADTGPGSLNEAIKDWARQQGVQFSCPNCGHEDLDEVTEMGVAAGEVHVIYGAGCPECGFWAVTSTIGKATARGRSHVAWPPEEPETADGGDGGA